MKVTKIKRLVSFGNHENIEMEAELEAGEDVTTASNLLLHGIYKQIKRTSDAEYIIQDINHLMQICESRLNQKENLDSEITELKNKKAKIEKWLEKFNISLDAFSEPEIPF